MSQLVVSELFDCSSRGESDKLNANHRSIYIQLYWPHTPQNCVFGRFFFNFTIFLSRGWWCGARAQSSLVAEERSRIESSSSMSECVRSGGSAIDLGYIKQIMAGNRVSKILNTLTRYHTPVTFQKSKRKRNLY